MKKNAILVILDGWGIGAKNATNPLFIAKLPNIQYIKSHFPSGALQASGIAVGLPWEEEGNSEVGHLTIGSGKVLYQHYPKITLAIRNKSFFLNPVLKLALDHARKNNSSINFIGLLTSVNIHASLEHLRALIAAAKEAGVNFKLHLFSDGRDSPPKTLLKLLDEIPEENLATLSGRHYAMDRDLHWDRTETAYKVITGQADQVSNYREIIKQYNDKNLSEEFIEPMVTRKNLIVEENDSVLFFNFREDSIRQLASSFVDKNFENFTTVSYRNLFIATMTTYSDKLDAPALFPTERIENPLARILSESGKVQLHMAETEKYAHVTYFFNGYKDAAFKNEYRVLVPSNNVPQHDELPEMKAKEITSRVLESMDERIFDFMVINYANADMIAHTGNFDAAVKAVETVDGCLGELIKKVMETGDALVITADHGNVEQMIDPYTAVPETKHNSSPVPIYMIGPEYQREVSPEEIEGREKEIIGIISDIAPTILEIMGLPQPREMTGTSLMSALNY